MALPGVAVVTGAMRPPSATVVPVVPAVTVAQAWTASTPVPVVPAVTVAAVDPNPVTAVTAVPEVAVAPVLTARLARSPGPMAVLRRQVAMAVRAVAAVRR